MCDIYYIIIFKFIKIIWLKYCQNLGFQKLTNFFLCPVFYILVYCDPHPILTQQFCKAIFSSDFFLSLFENLIICKSF